MSIELSYVEDLDVSAYWLTHEDPIFIMLDNLATRKNEKVEYIAKRINSLFLQEFICKEYHKLYEFDEYWCENNCFCRHVRRWMKL